MALTKCRECSGQVSTEAAACPHCGAPQRAVPPPLPPQVQRPPPLQWEICEIDVAVAKKSGLFTPGQAGWIAKATGPNGTYVAQESPTFGAFIDRDGGIRASSLTSSDAEQALDALTSMLLSEGWEFLGLRGESFWSKQFRRAVQ
jgi:hypothetical protein